MKLVPFSILTILSLLYAGLTITESVLYQTWDHAMADQRELQTKVVFFQHLNSYLEQLLKRLAVDSQHDPALADLLARNKVKVVISGVDTGQTTPGAPANPGDIPGAPARPTELPGPK